MVYVDSQKNAFRGMKMCHMMADTVEELHGMADRIGLKREWFQPKSIPHYDLSQSKRTMAVKLGAKEITSKEVVNLIKKHRERNKLAF